MKILHFSIIFTKTPLKPHLRSNAPSTEYTTIIIHSILLLSKSLLLLEFHLYHVTFVTNASNNTLVDIVIWFHILLSKNIIYTRVPDLSIPVPFFIFFTFRFQKLKNVIKYFPMTMYVCIFLYTASLSTEATEEDV